MDSEQDGSAPGEMRRRTDDAAGKESSSPASDPRHIVHLSPDAASLVDVASEFLVEAAKAGHSLMVVATADHRHDIERAMVAAGIDVMDAVAEGRYLGLDAANTLASLMTDEQPDAALFDRIIGGEVARLALSGLRVSAFDEMVGLLCEEGKSEAACTLEDLWNGLLARYPVGLMCAYPSAAFGSDDSTRARIVAAHSHVATAIGGVSPPSSGLRAPQSTHSSRDAALLAAIVDSSHDAIVSKDLSGRITSWNRGAENLFGYRAHEVIGKSIELLIPPDKRHEEPKILARIRAGEKIEHYETVRRRKDGSLVDISLSVSPLRDAKGRVVGASKIARDISERRRTQQLLDRAEERYGRLANILPVGVYACDARGAIVYFNEHAAAIWGRTPRLGVDQLCGSWRLLAPDSAQPLPPEESPMAVALRERRPSRNLEVLMERQDGSRVSVMMNVDIVGDGEGSDPVALAAFQDVTPLKEAQLELREADRRKDEFLATLAHELRNPLAPIVAGLEILELATDDVELLARTRRTMERQAHQLVRLVDDLLDVSRITTGKFQLKRRVTGLADVVQIAVDSSRPTVSESGHRLALDLPSAPIWLDADPNRLAQVFSNLLDNAIKYTPPGGRIRISAAVRGEYVVVSVEDNGIGVPGDKLDAIFDKFVQIDRPQERGYAGLGIGLTLVKAVTELHGGSVSVESRGPDQGTTFHVTLPIVVAPAGADSVTDIRDRASVNTRRVLVVDDNDAMVESLSTLIGLLGHEVRTASDGATALAIAEEFRPHIVLMDLGMPRMNGYEAAAKLRQQAWGSEMLLVALTGWGQDEHRRRTETAGFDRHVVKPIRQPDLERLFAEA
jgi:PAS domain S-box-containing protein